LHLSGQRALADNLSSKKNTSWLVLTYFFKTKPDSYIEDISNDNLAFLPTQR